MRQAPSQVPERLHPPRRRILCVGIKSLLNAVSITTVLIDVNAAQSKLVLLENFNENYSKCLRLLVKLQLWNKVKAVKEIMLLVKKANKDGKEVDVHMYRSMIGSLMYLTSSRPDIMFAVCACARYQVNPKVSHLHAVKRIFRLISWQCKKQTVVANSRTEAGMTKGFEARLDLFKEKENQEKKQLPYLVALFVEEFFKHILYAAKGEAYDKVFNHLHAPLEGKILILTTAKTLFRIAGPGRGTAIWLGDDKENQTQKPLLKDEDGEEVDVHMYRSMIGSLMYLTSSRPDIMFAVCACARYQVNPKVSHLHAVKRIFRYLKGQPKLGLWYPKDSPFDLVAYTDSDYAGASLDRKSTTRGKAKKSVRLIVDKLIEMELELMLVTQNTHNMVTFLSKPTESEGFEQIVVNAHPIKYVLTINPTIYISCIEQFWSTSMVKTINGEVQLHALVDGKKIIISEASVRRDLQLKDEEGIDCLPNSTIFEQLALMGYEKISQKLTFYKPFFSPQWKFLIHTILQCLNLKTTAWNEFSSTMASAIICLASN
ncbi:hypothetical protein Tco_1485600 [Tanacetum coccineum]